MQNKAGGHNITTKLLHIVYLLLSCSAIRMNINKGTRAWSATDIALYMKTLNLSHSSLLDPNDIISTTTVDIFNDRVKGLPKSIFIIIEKMTNQYLDKKSGLMDSTKFIDELSQKLENTSYEDFILVLFSIKDNVYMYIRTKTKMTFLEHMKLSYSIKKTIKYFNNGLYDQAVLHLADNIVLEPQLIDIGIPAILFLLFMILLVLHCAYENTMSAETTKNRASLKRKLMKLASIAHDKEEGSHIGELMCTICMQPLLNTPGVDIEFLVCDHRFHHNCISNWYSEFNCCPLCMAIEQKGTANSDYIQRLVEIQKKKYAGKIGIEEIDNMFELIKSPRKSQILKTNSMINIKVIDGSSPLKIARIGSLK